MILVLVTNPTIPADLKSLGDGQYNVREAATQHLQSLPGWTAPFLEHQASKAKVLEVRARCTRVQKNLQLKWKADLALGLFPTIPADLKALRHREYTVREAAMRRLESHSGFTASYLKYHARRITDPELRDRYERMAEKLEQKWNVELARLLLRWKEIKVKAEMQQYAQKLRARIMANLSKLSAEDLKLVEAQHASCPIHPHDPLGSKGVPVKIILKGQPVLLCCKDCIQNAKANPERTLAIVKELKEKPAPFLREDQFEKIKQMSKSSKKKSPRP